MGFGHVGNFQLSLSPMLPVASDPDAEVWSPSWSPVMKPDKIDIQPNDFAEVWKDAQLQRSEELGAWLKQLFRRRWQLDRPRPASSPPGRILATG
jgi:hypothetical protein